jgi:acetolactate synthase small subunit
MKHNIIITALNSEGAIERILGKIRSRGWKIDSLSAMTESDEQKYAISLIVAGERSIEQLVRQIEKLYDVELATVSELAKLEVVISNTDEVRTINTPEQERQLSFPLRYDSERWNSEKRAECNA